MHREIHDRERFTTFLLKITHWHMELSDCGIYYTEWPAKKDAVGQGNA
jgi:hypothetical protein